MTERDDAPEVQSEAEEARAPLALWKKVVLALSLVLGLAGAAVTMTADEPASAGDGNTTMMMPNSFGPDGQPLPRPAPQEAEAPLWAPLLAKGGLSFFIAFCIGFALRTFLKGTMLVIGVVALAVFGLQKAGILGEVNWERAQGYWDDLTANLGTQFESLRTFVTGSLPSAASGGVGLVAGFKR